MGESLLALVRETFKSRLNRQARLVPLSCREARPAMDDSDAIRKLRSRHSVVHGIEPVTESFRKKIPSIELSRAAEPTIHIRGNDARLELEDYAKVI